jgi:cell division protein FtsB
VRKEASVPGARGWTGGKVLVFSARFELGWRFLAVWLAVVGLVVISFLSGENGFQVADRLRKEREALELENSILRMSNERLRREIKLIRQEPSFLEWLARERLGMIGERERVYVFQ